MCGRIQFDTETFVFQLRRQNFRYQPFASVFVPPFKQNVFNKDEKDAVVTCP